MIDKSDWEAANAALIAEGRKRFDPPTVEEIEDYFGGKLEGDHAAHVREALTYYPELIRVMTLPPPDPNVRVLSDSERERDWAAIRRKLEPEPLPFITRRKVAIALAAAAVVGLTLAVVMTSRSTSNGPITPTKAPIVATWKFRPDGIAGAGQRPLQIHPCDRCILKVLSAYAGDFPRYRIDIVYLGVNPPRTVVSRMDIHRDLADGTWAIEVDGKRLPQGFYRLDLYGVRGDVTEKQSAYTFEMLGR